MDDLLIENCGKLRYLTLNRVQKHNAFDDTLLLTLQAALDAAIADPGVKVIILNANGENFSAGADLQWMQRMASYSEEENRQDALVLAKLMHSLYSSPKPTLAMIQGSAYGGGVGLACACDVAIGSEQSVYCFSEIKLGLIPAVISPYVIQAIGPRAAKALFMSAEMISAKEAKNLGLIHHCVPQNELADFTQNYASRLAQFPKQGLAACKALVDAVAYQPVDKRLLEFTADCIAKRRVSEEGQKGLHAFLAKKTPVWD